jgi:nitrite reductase/ring-hydroxylating ferredoxin subunit
MRFVPLEKLINMSDGYTAQRRLGFMTVVLVQRDGEHYVFEANCPHRDHPLDVATISAGEIRCGLHGYRFRLRGGDLIYASEESCRGLRVWPVYYEGTDIGVMWDESEY